MTTPDGSDVRAAQATSDSRGELLALLDALGTGVLLIEPSERIRFANRRAAAILDTPAERLVGASIADVLAPIAALVARAEGNAGRPVVRIVRRDGSAIDAGFTLTEAQVPGAGGTHFALSFQDITPLVRLEEERDRLLQLATVGEVMPSVLHETRNPLSAAITALEVLLEEGHGPELQSDLHAVLVEVRRAILTLDGLGSAGLEARTSAPHAVDHAVREVANVLGQRAERLGIRIEVAMSAMPLVPLDSSVVRAVVFNLVNNALQACRSGDSIRISGALENDVLLLSIADTGSGMTPDVLARCTELFFTTKHSGSGIGLALCNDVATKAGGSLRVESELGRGTTVHVRLPYRVRTSDPSDLRGASTITS